MQFRFDANQEFQLRAIESVVNLLEGQPRIGVELSFAIGGGSAAIPNRLDLEEAALLANLQAVQRENGFRETDSCLQMIEAAIQTGNGERQARFANFSVEMETGTGKTYVYLRTVLELFKRYGLRKFIIVVPSIAVREGVLKALKITEGHFRELYENTPYRYYVYDSSDVSRIRQFALSEAVEIMIMTIDSFNKASNVIRQSTDRLQGETPIHMVQSTRPILILDEPQNMESEQRVQALAALNPLFALRYSATHRNPYNVVYKLTPFEAYRQGLVKRIEVASVLQSDDENLPFLRLEGIRAEKKTLTARIALHKLMKDGTIKEKVVTIRPGESLEVAANRPEYGEFTVDEINASAGLVTFTNGAELRPGESKGADKEAIFAAQIQYTLEEHFRKQARLRGQGIKVLSLFFIDRVDNYASGEGIIRRLFNEAFDQLKQQYPEWKQIDAASVQAAYFAQRKTKTGDIILEDSKTGEAERDREAYELIMQAKERLLSFEEPTAFIFSHSALREGWDNPNIFQICTLNQTASEMKKRQEVGRGVRLAVNQSGERARDERVNVLTVVANESYEGYVTKLQSEIENEYGTEGLPPKPANARKKKTAQFRKQYALTSEFKELWEKIKHKTRYAVKIDSEQLIKEVVADLDNITIAPPRITIVKAEIVAEKAETYGARQMTGVKTVDELKGRYRFPDLIEVMQQLLEHTSPPVCLTRKTLLEIFRRTTQKQAALDNPFGFANEAVRIVKEKLAEQLVTGIQYSRIADTPLAATLPEECKWYRMEQFENIESWEDYLIPVSHSVYSHVIYESDVERRFAEELDKREDVRLFLKLPGWFEVDTPIGKYNPDWAIVMEDRDEHGEFTGKPLLYLVRETKDSSWPDNARQDELRKTQCGKKHFKDALGVDYKVVYTVNQLP